jgi:hypothetical protein
VRNGKEEGVLFGTVEPVPLRLDSMKSVGHPAAVLLLGMRALEEELRKKGEVCGMFSGRVRVRSRWSLQTYSSSFPYTL